MLVAYAGSAMGKLDPQKPPALICNLVGAAAVLWSLSADFNLSATIMESAWALVAAIGLGRWAIRR
jgi:hypothetical protein